MDALKYKTWLLKVSIHCEGCRRKVKKVLQSIDGVFTTTIDPQQQKVTVTGSVSVETLIKKLAKAGKHAVVWPENLAGKENGSNKEEKKKKKKKSEEREQENTANQSSAKNREFEKAEKNNGVSKSRRISKTGTGTQDKSPGGGQAPSSGGRDSGKKKNAQSGVVVGGTGSNNGLNSESTTTCAPAHTGFQSQFTQYPGQVVGQMNLSPTRQQSFLYPETCYPPMINFASYNRLCPMETVGGCGPYSYYVPQLPYMYADPYQLQSPPLIPFEIFSDENANGCSVM